MATYALVADLEAYISGGSGLTADDAEALLEKAERDVDYAAGAWPVYDTTNGLKFKPTSLPTWQADALNRATCAQAQYRSDMGDDFMVKAQHARVKGPDFEFWGSLSYIGPQAIRELASGGLLRGGPGGYGSVSMGPLGIGGGEVIGNL